jgi:hypothetical protein
VVRAILSIVSHDADARDVITLRLRLHPTSLVPPSSRRCNRFRAGFPSRHAREKALLASDQSQIERTPFFWRHFVRFFTIYFSKRRLGGCASGRRKPRYDVRGFPALACVDAEARSVRLFQRLTHRRWQGLSCYSLRVMEAAAETKRDEGVGELGTIKQASKVLNSSEDAQLKSMSIF